MEIGARKVNPDGYIHARDAGEYQRLRDQASMWQSATEAVLDKVGLGQGMPVLRSKQQGDLYIQVEVETPKNLSRKQRDLLKAFEEASNPDTSPASSGFFARVKEFFEGIRE